MSTESQQQIAHDAALRLTGFESNLRFATDSQNAVNQKTRNDNTSGCRGVHWHKGSGKWQARIRVNQKYQTLGTFPGIDDAIQAYQNASKIHFGNYRR